MTTKQGVVYLMAGAGPGTGRKAVRYHDELVRLVGKKKPVIAYVGACAGDNLGFEKMIGALVFGLTAKVVPIRLSKKNVPTSEAKSKLEDADIVFFTGGDVHAGMEIIDERGMAGFFRELSARGKPMEGVSAGSILLGRQWVVFPDEGEPSVFDCLDVVPHSFDAHDEDNEWEELHVLAKLLPKREDLWVCGLVSGSCGVWKDGALSARGGPLHRFAAGTSRKLADIVPE